MNTDNTIRPITPPATGGTQGETPRTDALLAGLLHAMPHLEKVVSEVALMERELATARKELAEARKNLASVQSKEALRLDELQAMQKAQTTLRTAIATAQADCARLFEMETAARLELAKVGAELEEWRGVADQLAGALKTEMQDMKEVAGFSGDKKFEEVFAAPLAALRAYEEAKGGGRK